MGTNDFNQLTDASIALDTNRHYARMDSGNIEERIEELKDEYMDDTDIITDTILDGSFIDCGQFWNTFRSMVNAQQLGNEKAMTDFAKSLSLDVICAIAKRAEHEATK
jgi:hypothetical protein